jgi:hypothetical protein
MLLMRNFEKGFLKGVLNIVSFQHDFHSVMFLEGYVGFNDIVTLHQGLYKFMFLLKGYKNLCLS